MRFGLAFGVFFGLVGCGYTLPIAGEGWNGPTNPQPNQDQAIHIVWDVTFGMEGYVPPQILWHFNDNCVDSHSNNGPEFGTPGAFKSAHSDVCEFGQFEDSGWVEPTEFDAPERIDIEWHGSFSDNGLGIFAHELCHAVRDYLTGDGDVNHQSDCFSMPGQPYQNSQNATGSRVDMAQQALVAAGL